MLRQTAPVLALLVFSALVGCSASGGSSAGASRGGGESGGTGGKSASAGAGGSATGASGSSGAAGSGTTGGSAGSSALGSAGSGGAVGTGGSGGSAGSSSGGGGASSATPPLFSDDFEAMAIDYAKWTAVINDGTTVSSFSLDTSQKHGGKQSLHLNHTGFSTMLAAQGAPIFPAPSNTYYARVWIRVASQMGGLPTGHVIWIQSGDVTVDTHEVRIGANLGYFQSNLIPSDADIRDPMANMTTDAWHCLQMKYGVDTLEVSLDGVMSSISTTNWVAAISANGNTTPMTGWSPTYAAFRIGWELGNGEVWYDDVALDHIPIPCN
jgi:hypothetical protein